MIFRAVTVENKPFYFNITDAPVSINDKLSILIRRPGTPLLYSKSIMRGVKSKEFFESDFVLSKENKFLGYVIYKDGFYVYNANTNLCDRIIDSTKYIFAANIMQYRIGNIANERSPINFVHEGRQFKLNRIMFADDKELYIDLKQTRRPAILDEIKICTGQDCNGVEFYFGQSLKDGVVELYNNQPMIRMFNNEFREIEKGDYNEQCKK